MTAKEWHTLYRSALEIRTFIEAAGHLAGQVAADGDLCGPGLDKVIAGGEALTLAGERLAGLLRQLRGVRPVVNAAAGPTAKAS